MSAYSPRHTVNIDSNTPSPIYTISGSISPSLIEVTEILAANGEIIFGPDGDYVKQRLANIPIVLTLVQTVTIPDDGGGVPPSDAYGSVTYATITFDVAPPPGDYYGVETLLGNAAFELFMVFNGYDTDVVTTLELPFAGHKVARTTRQATSTYISVNALYFIVKAVGDPSTYSLYGDHTIECTVACDSSAPFFIIQSELLEITLGSPVIPPVTDYSDNGLKAVTSFTGATPNWVWDIVNWYPTPLTYYHIALVREGNVLTLYVDGTAVASLTQALTYNMSAGYRIYAKYLAQVRFTEAARYTASFVPPADLFF